MRHLGVLAAILCAGAAPAQSPLPFAMGGPFELIDQFGHKRSEKDPGGHPQLVFFGYANCPNICSAALPTMAAVVDELAEDGIMVTPVMITVAPDQDRVDTMQAPLAEMHPRFIGLTGDPASLQVAYDAFAVEVEPIFQDPEYGWIYSHGSFIHLLDKDGEVLTLFPPVLDAGKTVSILKKYLSADSKT